MDKESNIFDFLTDITTRENLEGIFFGDCVCLLDEIGFVKENGWRDC